LYSPPSRLALLKSATHSSKLSHQRRWGKAFKPTECEPPKGLDAVAQRVATFEGTRILKNEIRDHLTATINASPFREKGAARGEVILMTLRQTCSREDPEAPFAFKDSMIHILQFTLRIAACCVLHRCTSQEIHRCKLSIGFVFCLLAATQLLF
jgi:hypothetical protein